ncbi:MAG: DoxX family protein [bacterium]|nr:DoxX family protein [bacterium]
MRLVAGLGLAFGHGVHKLPPSEKFIEGVAKLGFPYPDGFAWAAAISEFGGGICIALGLGTRIWGFFVAFTMGTALFRHMGQEFGEWELAAMYFACTLFLMFIGGGKYAADRRFA